MSRDCCLRRPFRYPVSCDMRRETAKRCQLCCCSSLAPSRSCPGLHSHPEPRRCLRLHPMGRRCRSNDHKHVLADLVRLPGSWGSRRSAANMSSRQPAHTVGSGAYDATYQRARGSYNTCLHDYREPTREHCSLRAREAALLLLPTDSRRADSPGTDGHRRQGMTGKTEASSS